LTSVDPSFYSSDAVIEVFRRYYECEVRAYDGELIVVRCSGDRATILSATPTGIALRILAGALAVVRKSISRNSWDIWRPRGEGMARVNSRDPHEKDS
jgi:hypothetical protein